jgi:hypothetical protein
MQLKDFVAVLAERRETSARCGARVQQLKVALKAGDESAVKALDQAHRRIRRLQAQVRLVLHSIQKVSAIRILVAAFVL